MVVQVENGKNLVFDEQQPNNRIGVDFIQKINKEKVAQ